ncbi:hypothetical protein CK247_29740 [Klebsiella pneumoniae]|nr:hypothetical protein CK247_29740 [Klebsiella pneumoniae]
MHSRPWSETSLMLDVFTEELWVKVNSGWADDERACAVSVTLTTLS